MPFRPTPLALASSWALLKSLAVSSSAPPTPSSSMKGLIRPNATSLRNLDTSGPVSFTSEVNAPFSFDSRLFGVSYSATRPRSMTSTRSASMMVLILCAMVNIVQSLNSERIVFWIKSSVFVSTAAVASSRTRIFECLRRALAIQRSCLCPTLKFSPPASTSTSRTDSSFSSKGANGVVLGTGAYPRELMPWPEGRDRGKQQEEEPDSVVFFSSSAFARASCRFSSASSCCFFFMPLRTVWSAPSRCALRIACTISWSSCSLKGSILNRIVPRNKTGSCGMIDNFSRRDQRPILVISTLSITILPPHSSTRRYRVTKREDFPAPVLPTMPTFSPGLTSKLSPRRTRGRPGL
mmetsp:Transcript_13169/g.18231  ORF Transcript_13169/g.18231 Transcript_13169/m.18231 type:complete len:351 (-) Transcript_13169:4033-5085(-)